MTPSDDVDTTLAAVADALASIADVEGVHDLQISGSSPTPVRMRDLH